jgi:protein-tyrosine phosphatase
MIYDMNKLTIDSIEGIIFLGRAPGHGSDRHEDFREIKQAGVSKIYSLQEEQELLYLSNGTENIENRRESLSALGIEMVHSPVRDFGVPAIEQAEELTKMILSDVTEGKNVLIHCMGGLGRTGTIVACVLVRTGISPDNAVAKVRSVRHGTLENDAQVGFVREFGERIKSGSL